MIPSPIVITQRRIRDGYWILVVPNTPRAIIECPHRPFSKCDWRLFLKTKVFPCSSEDKRNLVTSRTQPLMKLRAADTLTLNLLINLVALGR